LQRFADDLIPNDGLIERNQVARLTRHATCWGQSASKSCTGGSTSDSPQAQQRSEYRSLAVMRNAHTA
jgi:hypothetical protein